MKRLTECWLEFDGIRDADIRVQLAHLPTREMPVLRGNQYKVLGRSGVLFVPEGEQAFESIGIVAYLTTLDGFSAAEFSAWLLKKEALLRFSDEPDRAYMAQVLDQPSRTNILERFDTQSIPVTFSAQPWRYHFPAADAINVSASGDTINNPGTAPSAPRITVIGTGDITLTVGGTLMEFTGVTDGIIVDTQAMDCLALDGLTLANQHAILDDFPLLNVGPNIISWTGNVSNVTILPRWRDI